MRGRIENRGWRTGNASAAVGAEQLDHVRGNGIGLAGRYDPPRQLHAHQGTPALGGWLDQELTTARGDQAANTE